MPSVKNYQNEYLQRAKSKNPASKPLGGSKTLADTISDKKKERLKRWITFYRQNPHIFIEQYFQIKLYPYQVVMIWMLNNSNIAYIVASRAIGKSWIIAVWALTLAVLYPGMQVVICAKTIKQGGLILSDKLKSLQDKYSNVAREITKITTNSNEYKAYFNCGSTIEVVSASVNSLGHRANYIIVEESKLVPREIIESVLRPFLYSRTPLFRTDKQYTNDKRYIEEGRISYITSAWYKSEYWFSAVKSVIKSMVAGDVSNKFMALDYSVAIHHNIKTKLMLRNEMKDTDPMAVQMEYLNIPSGTSGKSYFKPAFFTRNVSRAFYVTKNEDFNKRKTTLSMPKALGEIRIVSVDIATRAGRGNDNSVISTIRLLPMQGKGYDRYLVGMESYKGANVVLQSQKIKETFFDFGADYVVLDLQQAGKSVFDILSQSLTHEERGIPYPAFTVVDDLIVDDILAKELRAATMGVDALPVIYPIRATQQLNSVMAASLRASLQRKMWKFLITDSDAEVWLLKNNKEFLASNEDPDTYSYLMNPYTQTNLLINECVNLDMSIVNGLVRLTEQSGHVKDRFTTMLYANYIIANCFDINLLKEQKEESMLDYLSQFVCVV